PPHTQSCPSAYFLMYYTSLQLFAPISPCPPYIHSHECMFSVTLFFTHTHTHTHTPAIAPLVYILCLLLTYTRAISRSFCFCLARLQTRTCCSLTISFSLTHIPHVT